jgi:hypothetical protein
MDFHFKFVGISDRFGDPAPTLKDITPTIRALARATLWSRFHFGETKPDHG